VRFVDDTVTERLRVRLTVLLPVSVVDRVRLGLRVNVWLDVADLLKGGVVGIDDLLFVMVGLTLRDKDVVIDLLNG